MKLTITGRNIEITRAHRSYIRKRFAKWSNFLHSGTVVHVILAVEGYRHIAEVTAKDKNYKLTGKQITKDLYQSIDLLAEKINRQLAKQHEKLINKDAAARSREKRMPMVDMAGKDVTTTFKEPQLLIETLAGKPMSAEEAMLQLKSSRKAYLVFEEAESGQLAVLSKEKNNKMKLIIKE